MSTARSEMVVLKDPFPLKGTRNPVKAADSRSRQGTVHKRLEQLFGAGSNRVLRDTKGSVAA